MRSRRRSGSPGRRRSACRRKSSAIIPSGMATRTKIPTKRGPSRRKPRKAKAGTRGLTALECRLDTLSGEGNEVRTKVENEGGFVLGCYNDPLGKNPLILAVLPLEAVEPTPFQRDLSDMHHKRLADVLDRTGIFLDPVIAVTAPEKGFWTPKGPHRLEGMRGGGGEGAQA